MRFEVEARLSGFGCETGALPQKAFEIVERLADCLSIRCQRISQCRADAHLEKPDFLVSYSPGFLLGIEQRLQGRADLINVALADRRRLAQGLIGEAPASFDVSCLGFLAIGDGAL
ncbi:hypothetical protein [Mesorhizobium sp. WSM3879]|uniref:hypothetical protein n=1 Tax=Mesorhizobium sp. WSM3879 TaxID=2029406 RepID=UPI00117D2A5F|nr:hypothetical protein [Mesorhizobium sp. WSM3879]